MKRQQFRYRMLALLLVGLFVLLGVSGIRSLSVYGGRWYSYAANPRLSSLQQKVVKGNVQDRNGTSLASTVEGKRVFADSADTRRAVVHLLGDREGMVANGIETFHAGYLYGASSSLMDAIRHLTHPAEERRGNTLTLTVDAALCEAVPKAFEAHPLTRDRNGAAVVLNYLTGEVLALVSLPSFDPDHASPESIAALDHPYWNRATQGLYPPGSTFKIVTTAAALEKLPGVQSRAFDCEGSLPVSDTFAVHDFQNAAHGTLRLEQAFLRSCNIVYAELAREMGDAAMKQTAERFGFNRNFLFRDLVLYNSVYPAGPQSPEGLAASGYGQSSLLVSPLHLCLISAAIANGGRMPEPRLLRKVTSQSGGVVLSFSSAEAMSVCSSAIADQISQMMKNVVQGGGSGSQAAVTTLDIRGKTGTSESSLEGKKINYGWFTGFNAQKDLPFAVCVLVEDIPEGETGGSTAALIARDLFTWLKGHPESVTQ